MRQGRNKLIVTRNKNVPPVAADDILRIAARVFAEKGFERATVAEIAREVGVQKASVYYHIGSKQELLYEVINSGMRTMLSALEGVVTRNESPLQKVRSIVVRHMSWFAQNADVARVILYDRKRLTSSRWNRHRAMRRKYDEHFRKIVREGIATGEIRPVHPTLIPLTILDMCSWFLEWFDLDGSMPIEEFVCQVADFVVHGLAAGSPEHKAQTAFQPLPLSRD